MKKKKNYILNQGCSTFFTGQSNEESINLLRERLQGAIGHQDQRKVSTQSAASMASTTQRQTLGARASFNSGGSGGAYTGIQNPAVDSFQPPPPVPHFDQGGISQRRGSRPPADMYDPYNRRMSTEPMGGSGMGAFRPNSPSGHNPGVAPPNPSPFVPNYSNPTPNIFTPDFSYGQAPPSSGVAPPPSGVAPPPHSRQGKYYILRKVFESFYSQKLDDLYFQNTISNISIFRGPPGITCSKQKLKIKKDIFHLAD